MVIHPLLQFKLLKKRRKICIPEPSFGTEKSVQCFVRYTFCKVERYLGSPLKSSSFFKRALFSIKCWFEYSVVKCSRYVCSCMLPLIMPTPRQHFALLVARKWEDAATHSARQVWFVEMIMNLYIYIYISVHGIMLGGVRWMAGVTSSAYGHVLGKAGVTCM